MYRKILLAIALQNWEEFTPHALAARDAAVCLAKGSPAMLHILTVCDYSKIIAMGMPEHLAVSYQMTSYINDQIEKLEKRVREKLELFVKNVRSEGVVVKTLLRTGNPREEIVKVAEEVGADLIVIGTHSKRSFLDVLLGGTAYIVTSKAPCPVLLVSAPR
ncbi:MAG: universal stress protein [Candidatus Tectomicrobia bacterium]|nr:universal stress protein [Candidatus Tectomicrobia bacterium]